MAATPGGECATPPSHGGVAVCSGAVGGSVAEDGLCVFFDPRSGQEVGCFAPGVGMRVIAFEDEATVWLIGGCIIGILQNR